MEQSKKTKKLLLDSDRGRMPFDTGFEENEYIKLGKTEMPPDTRRNQSNDNVKRSQSTSFDSRPKDEFRNDGKGKKSDRQSRDNDRGKGRYPDKSRHQQQRVINQNQAPRQQAQTFSPAVQSPTASPQPKAKEVEFIPTPSPTQSPISSPQQQQQPEKAVRFISEPLPPPPRHDKGPQRYGSQNDSKGKRGGNPGNRGGGQMPKSQSTGNFKGGTKFTFGSKTQPSK